MWPSALRVTYPLHASTDDGKPDELSTARTLHAPHARCTVAMRSNENAFARVVTYVFFRHCCCGKINDQKYYLDVRLELKLLHHAPALSFIDIEYVHLKAQ